MRRIALGLWAFAFTLSCEALGDDGPPGLLRIDPPAAQGALAPNLTPAEDGAFLTWLEPVQPEPFEKSTTYRLRCARFSGGAWSEPKTIVERDDLFANWADLPSLAQAADGTLIAHWLQKSAADTYAYDVMLARSTDGGQTWQPLGPAHDDATKTEHGFVSLVPEPNGVRAFWLDGREMATGAPGLGKMTLRTALIGDSVGQGAVLDEMVCECCSTSAVMTASGPLIVYRDRSPEETRDISLVRRVGGRWTRPRTLHADGWLIAGCPVNGPAADARGERVAIAWYTGAVSHGAVLIAFSQDDGATFSPPITVDDTWPLGRVDVLLVDSGQAIVVWLDTAEGGGAIMLRRVAEDGRVGAPIPLATASLARASGFPKMERNGPALLVVWTQDGDPSRLQAASVPLDGIPGPAPAH